LHVAVSAPPSYAGLTRVSIHLQKDGPPGQARWRRIDGVRKASMQFTLTTWNINSVRLRINLVAKFLKSVRPDVLCLQETKCPDDAFPLKRFKRLGYEHDA